MNVFYKTLAFLVVFFLPSFVQASSVDVSLDAPTSHFAKICPVPVFKNKKGKLVDEIKAANNISGSIEKSIKGLLSHCGIIFVSKSGSDVYDVSSEIKTFSADVDKSFVKSRYEAHSKIALTFETDYTSNDVAFNMDMDGQIPNIKIEKRISRILSAFN